MFPTHVLHLSRPDLYVNAPGPGSSVEPHVKATLEELGALKDYRATPDQVTHLRDILKEYIGTKNHHNFTVGKKFADKSAMRHIKSFDCSEPFMRRGLEWISCKVHGQSFMLHQIRKMMGLALLMVRTRTPASLMTQVFQATKMNIPRAPALGLLLDRTVYEAYNDRIKNLPAREEGRAPLTFEPFSKDIQAFKEAWVYETMVQEELDKGVYVFFSMLINEIPNISWSCR